jgi:hypothetical protein
MQLTDGVDGKAPSPRGADDNLLCSTGFDVEGFDGDRVAVSWDKEVEHEREWNIGLLTSV